MREFYKIILDQLGGKRFIVMTGAKQFVYDNAKQALTFKIGGGAKDGINYVKVTLTPMDLYDVEFFKVRGMDLAAKGKTEGLYADQLRAVFMAATGFDVTL